MTFSASPQWYEDMYVLHFTPSKSPPKGTVFILHGYPSLGRKNYDFAEVVAANNYEVYVPHYPGLGLSKGQFGFLRSYESVRKLIYAVKINENNKLSIIGHSWGGYLALLNSDLIDDTAIFLAPLPRLPTAVDFAKFYLTPGYNSNFESLENFSEVLLAIAPEVTQHYSATSLNEEIVQMQILEKQRLESRPMLRILVIHGDNDIDIPIEFVDTTFKENWDQTIDVVNDDHNLDVVRRELYQRISVLFN
jgi:esterase/lipase